MRRWPFPALAVVLAAVAPSPAAADEARGEVNPIERILRSEERLAPVLADAGRFRLQRALCKVVRPEVDAGGAGFQLSDRQRGLLLESMRQYPRQSTNPVYDPREYPDDYVKFLLPGLERVVPKERLAIYNKVGQAYGFSVENAYVEDSATGRAFFLAAVIYTNDDGVLNDDAYEYDEVALPFFEDLGETVARVLWAP